LKFLVGEYDPRATVMLNIKQSYVNSQLQKRNKLRKQRASGGFGTQIQGSSHSATPLISGN
jgi:hypothetical protein